MEAITKRLEFKCPLIQIQGILALKNEIAKTLRKHSATGFNTPHSVKELEYLLTLCISRDQTVSTSARKALVELITSGLVDLEGCMRELVIMCNTMRGLKDPAEIECCYAALLELSTELIRMQVKSSKALGTFPDSTHIYIVCCMNTELPWLLITQAFSDSLLIEDSEEWINVFNYHQPFLQYVFMNTDDICLHVLPVCLSNKENLEYSLCTMLNMLQKSQVLYSIKSLSCLEILWKVFASHGPSFRKGLGDDMVKTTLLALCKSKQKHVKLWITLASYISRNEIILYNCYMLLASCLTHNLNSGAMILIPLLTIIQVTLTKDTSSPSRQLLYVPLLELMTVQNLISNQSESPLQASAMKCRDLLNQRSVRDADSDEETNVQEEGRSETWYFSQLEDPEFLTRSDPSLYHDVESCRTYLSRVLYQLEHHRSIYQCTVYQVSALLLNALHVDIQKLSLDVIEKIVLVQPEQASSCLLLLTQWLKRPLHPEVILYTLHKLPAFTTHQYNMAAVLKYLDSLVTGPRSRALTIRLLCDVAVTQSKLYPHLINVIKSIQHSSSTADVQPDTYLDVLIARMFAVKHVCDKRPDLGKEVLPIISEALDPNSESHVSVKCLALQSLSLLVQAEIIDMKTIWEVLSDALLCDESEEVQASICDFLSLSSLLPAEISQSYKEFKEQTISLLWLWTRHEASTQVSVAAYKALINFPLDSVKYSYLPAQIQTEFAPDYSEDLDKYNSKTVETEAIVKLCASLRLGEHEAFGHLLSTYINQELDLYGPTMSRQSLARGQKNLPQSVRRVPVYIQNIYKESRTRGREASSESLNNLTAAMLYCHETMQLKPSTSKGEMRACVATSRQTLEEITVYVREATVLSLSDSNANTQLLSAWVCYITHVLNTVLTGKLCETKLANQPCTYWEALFRAKDLIDTNIVTSVKGHDSESNALLALTALMISVRSLTSEAVENGDGRQELPTTYTVWEKNHIQAMLSIVQQKLNKDVFHWLSSPELPVLHTTVWNCLSFVPLSTYTDNVDALQDCLNEITKKMAQNNRDLQQNSNNSLYWGQLCNNLISHGLHDSSDEQTSTAILECVNSLIERFSEERKSSIGILRMVPALLSESLHLDQIKDIMARLRFNQTDSEEEMYAKAILTRHMYSAHLIPSEQIDQECQELFSHIQVHPTKDLASALGCLINAMSEEFHPTSNQWFSQLSATWIEQLKSDEVGVVLSAIDGLLSLTGIHPCQIGEDTEQTLARLMLCEKVTENLLRLDKLSPTKYYSIRLGWIQYTLSSLLANKQGSSYPATYKHSLNNSSFIRHVLEMLISITKSLEVDKELSIEIKADCLLMLLRCIQKASERTTLPPLNWSAILSPLMRVSCSAGDEIRKSCLLIAVARCGCCQLSKGFLTKWCSLQKFSTLSTSVQTVLMSNIHRYIDHISLDRLRAFRDRVWLTLSNHADESERRNLRSCMLKSLSQFKDLLKPAPDKPQAVKQATMVFYYQTLQALIRKLDVESVSYLSDLTCLAECISCCEDTLTDTLLASDLPEYTKLHLTVRLIGKTTNTDQIFVCINKLISSRDVDWIVQSVEPCFLTIPDPRRLFMRLQDRIKETAEIKANDCWLAILTSAVIEWSGGLHVPAKDLHSVLVFYLNKLLAQDQWTQLSKQTRAWINEMTSGKNISEKWRELFQCN